MRGCTKGVIALATTMSLSTSIASSQDAESNLADLGQSIYEQNCAFCHQPDGIGDPPTFPALAGNENLQDLETIVRNVHLGREAMPPFPDLSAEQIAAVATYIRGSWENDLPTASIEEVASLLAELETEGEQLTIWDGVYTEAQAERGRSAYTGPCGLCHGSRLDGAPNDPDMRPAPPLARYKFIRDWDGRSLASLYEFTRATMPQSNPGYMDDQTYADIIAYMLETTGAPPGDEELAPDPQELARITIRPEP